MLLGILKAGAVYVPLDPAWPNERIAFIIEDAAVERVLTQRALRDRLPNDRVPVVEWEEIAPAVAAGRAESARALARRRRRRLRHVHLGFERAARRASP